MLRGMTEPQNAIAETPAPPYYAVVFTSVRTEVHEGYAEMAAAMAELAARQPGYLGIESAREGLGITVSYWRDLEAIAAWKRVVDHVAAQRPRTLVCGVSGAGRPRRARLWRLLADAPPSAGK
jgi:heme-degrading monooxygenase HmoA